MTRYTIALLLPAILFFAACSSTTQKSESTAQPAAKQEAKTETLTGREAFQRLYPAARGWQPDARPVRIESQSTSDATGEKGEAAVWRVLFASPGRQKLETFSWSGSTTSDPTERGVTHGTEDTFSPSNASTQPFDLNYLKIDSPAALETAQKHGGDKLLKTAPKTPIQYLLDWDPRKTQLVWHVIYGNSRNDSKLTVDLDASSGLFIRIEK